MELRCNQRSAPIMAHSAELRFYTKARGTATLSLLRFLVLAIDDSTSVLQSAIVPNPSCAVGRRGGLRDCNELSQFVRIRIYLLVLQMKCLSCVPHER